MEKRKPHYNLNELKKLFNNEETRVITRAARQGAAAMGYMDEYDIVEVIGNLCSDHFYKSMTSNLSSKIWQDVYKFRDEEQKLYIKLQLSIDETQTVLIQMKKDEGD
jgi:hypothetical protein